MGFLAHLILKDKMTKQSCENCGNIMGDPLNDQTYCSKCIKRVLILGDKECLIKSTEVYKNGNTDRHTTTN